MQQYDALSPSVLPLRQTSTFHLGPELIECDSRIPATSLTSRLLRLTLYFASIRPPRERPRASIAPIVSWYSNDMSAVESDLSSDYIYMY